MKKILSLSLLLVLSVAAADAKQRKTWDFTEGISDETLVNLIADEDWTVTYDDDGTTFKQAVDATKMYGTLQANGVDIEEFSELTFGSDGLQSGGNNFIIGASKFRMTRANSSVIFHVAPGQTITIKGRSANSSAEDRGLVGDDNLEYISGPAGYNTGDNGGVMLGSSFNSEERDENGNYTLVWQVSEDLDDSVDVSISCYPSGGLDLALFQIDEGDDAGDTGTHVLYLYDSSYPDYTFGSDDFIYDVVSEACIPQIDDTDILAVDIADNPTELTKDSLEYYDLVVLSSAISSTSEYISTICEAVAYVPMLNTSPDLYEAWGYGTAVQTETNMLTIGNKAKSSELFVNSYGESMLTDGEMPLYGEATIRGYELADSSYIANDSVWATADGVYAMHVHNAGRNAYMMVPYTFPYGDVTDDFQDFMYNIVVFLLNTKEDVANAGKPRVEEEYVSTGTYVTLISSTSTATIYYTVDGTDPTRESTEYTEPFFIGEEGVTVKAFAVADGYDDSDILEQEINIYELLDAPSISYEEQGDTTVITITPASEEDVIYYNFTASDETTSSSEYTDVVKITKHATITAFAAARDPYLQSETVSMDIPVANENVRLDEVSHMDAEKSYWNVDGSNPYYYNTKSGHAYYTDVIIGTDDDGDTLYEPADSIVYYDPGTGWEVRTLGQVMYWQNNEVKHNVGDGDAYNPETALDDDEDATSYCITFGGTGASNSDGVSGPAFTGSIQSTEKFQGPFDIVSNICTTSSSSITVKAYVTTDTLSGEWTEVGDLKTGTQKRLWKHTVLGYEGTDSVFVKVCGNSGAGVFDLFIMNAGELSEEYLSGIVDIQTGNDGCGEIIRTDIYSINGTRRDNLAKGLNIIREVYSDGTVKARKVVVK